MDKVILIQMEWVEELMVEWEIWEWKEGTINIYSNINNTVELKIMVYMEPHIKEWAWLEVIMVVPQIH